MGDEELNNSTKEDHEESRGAVGGRDDKKKDKSIIKFGKTLAKEFDLKDTTIDILLDNEIDSMSALATLSKDDVLSFNLSLGQKNLLLKCVASLTPADTHAAHESTLSKDARSRQKEVAGLDTTQPPDVRSRATPPQDVRPRTTTPPQDVRPRYAPSDPYQDSTLSTREARDSMHAAMNPPNPATGEFSPNLPISNKQIQAVPRPFQFIEGKKSYGELSLSEHMYASLLILENMLMAGDQNSVAYTRHLSFLALKSSQHFTTESILTYDNAVRSSVDRSGTWPRDSDMHLANCHLIRAYRNKPQKDQPRRSRPPMEGNPLNNRCIRFNTLSCDAGDRCKYDHKCINCNGSHPMSTCKSAQSKPKSQ